MIELPANGLAVTGSQLLAGIASALLVFVSVGVIYLSAVEWRDRRRRRAAETSGGKARSKTSTRSSAAFGRRP